MTPLPFLNFIHKPKNELEKGGRTAALVQEDASEPEKTCPNCHKSIPLSRLWSNWNTCACGYHFRMGGRQRLRFLADKGSFQELFSQVEGREMCIRDRRWTWFSPTPWALAATTPALPSGR